MLSWFYIDMRGEFTYYGLFNEVLKSSVFGDRFAGFGHSPRVG
jgi:hypothetical protein